MEEQSENVDQKKFSCTENPMIGIAAGCHANNVNSYWTNEEVDTAE